MSAAAEMIIRELPKLTEGEMREVRRRLLELTARNAEIAACDAAAAEGAAMLDRLDAGSA